MNNGEFSGFVEFIFERSVFFLDIVVVDESNFFLRFFIEFQAILVLKNHLHQAGCLSHEFPDSFVHIFKDEDVIVMDISGFCGLLDHHGFISGLRPGNGLWFCVFFYFVE